MGISTGSAEQTKNEARKLAQKLAKSNKKIIALTGDLGSGKTTFVQGFAQGLGIKDKIISPTFVLIRQHPIPNEEKLFYHVDLYRLEDKASLDSIGISDLLNSDNLVLIEWADRLGDELSGDAVLINIEKLEGDRRRLQIKGAD